MIIRILLIIIMLVLFFVAYYLQKNNQSFSKVLAGDTPQEPIQAIFKQFAKTCLILGAIGLVFFILGHKTLALTYIAVVMIASAIFSIKLSKLIS
ncbi:hypothetical protein I6N95_02990 [Vagococcus sp. BWB3-3]|uniref:DUF3784 domain-containing protein n=1 Tax=Vagococcus allomyrinae TaxID=2794353 RepID=A0A940P8D7_9ENTE|nr:hypothetical protein [Vagococcus allomyrinae]MBP1039970.1 hypothetical protein [Vagococcus allomyrinae]